MKPQAKLAEAVEGTPAVTEAQMAPHEGGSMADNLPMLFFVLVPPVLCATFYPGTYVTRSLCGCASVDVC